MGLIEMDYDDASAVFRLFDFDKSESIDEVELFAALSDFGLSATQIDDIFYELDVDGNGAVNQAEFAKGWNAEKLLHPAAPAPTPDPLYQRKRELVFAILCGLD